MTGRPRPDLRGRLRAGGAIQAELLVGSRARRWTVIVATLAIIAIVVAVTAVLGVPFALGMAVALVAALVGGLWLGLALMPPADRPLAGALLVGGRRELTRYRRATGRRLPPRTGWGIARWLARVPDTPATRPIRVGYLTTAGRTDEAAATVARLEPSSAFERFDAARLAAMVEFEAGGSGDLGPARQAFGSIDDPIERSTAAWQLALEDARQRYVRGEDWRAPLALAAGSGPASAGRLRAWLPTVVWAAAPLLVAIYMLALLVELAATGSVV